MKILLKRYAFSVIAVLALCALLVFSPESGAQSLDKTLFGIKEMLLVVPPIFVLLGLLDVWVPRETMVRFLGNGSGLRGGALAVLLGSAAAGPLYAAFPVAAIFMKKGASFLNILLFLGAWSTTKIPMLLFELASMGPVFTFTRLAVSLAGIIIIAHIVNKLVSKDEISRLYENAKGL